MPSPVEPTAVVEAFAAALAARCAESLIDLLEADCRFELACGERAGQTVCGREAVIAALRDDWTRAPGQRVRTLRRLAHQGIVMSEWRAYAPSGRLTGRGCDVFEVRGGRIAACSAYGAASAAGRSGGSGGGRLTPLGVKYARSALSETDYDMILRRIERAVREQQIHRDPQLDLRRLARWIRVPSNQVSQALNVRAGGFHDWLSSTRVADVQLLIQDSRDVSGLLDAAFAVGFNSKSTFYEAFRRATGLTPGAWRDQVAPGRGARASSRPALEDARCAA